jgi:hypothetical protein
MCSEGHSLGCWATLLVPASITLNYVIVTIIFIVAGGSKKAIYAALFGNLGIAIAKFIAVER